MAEDTRCPTGIEGLDEILGGGIPRGNTVLVAGASGVGKTTLGFQFLCEGARRKEPSAFVSVTEPVSMLKRNLSTYQFYKPEYLEPNRLAVLDLRAVALRMGLQDGMFQPAEYLALVDTLHMVTRELKLKRLVLDSVTAVCQWLQEPVRIRDFVFRLGLALGEVQCTTLLTSEVPPREFKFSVFGVEEFISDGIFFLSEEEHGKGVNRTLQVVKMRGTPHDLGRHFMRLTSDGIVVGDGIKKSTA